MLRHLTLLALLAGACATRPSPGGTPIKRDPSGGRYAYVMLAFDPPGTSPRSLWGVLPIARALQELSSYPLVVLTNTTHFPDGTPVKETLAKLNAQVLSVKDVPVPDSVLHEYRNQPCEEVNPPVCVYQYLKLQIWLLTQFDKLIWMDSDAILTKSIDGLFLQNGTWAQQDNWDCGSWASFAARNSPLFTSVVDQFQRRVMLDSFQSQDPHVHHSDAPCSGFMLLEPNRATYQGILQYLSTLTSAPGGDQQVITDYFKKVKKDPLKVVDLSVASFGQCLDKVPAGKIPAFVHKSDWVNRCFTASASANDCRDHPLGRYWHKLFCDALSTMGFRDKNLTDICTAWENVVPEQAIRHGWFLWDTLGFVVVAIAIGIVVALGACAFYATKWGLGKLSSPSKFGDFVKPKRSFVSRESSVP